MQTSSPTGWPAHARLKNVFTEDEKYQNLMKWLKSLKYLGSLHHYTNFIFRMFECFGFVQIWWCYADCKFSLSTIICCLRFYLTQDGGSLFCFGFLIVTQVFIINILLFIFIYIYIFLSIFIDHTNMSHVMRKPAFVICEQQRRRLACASAQSDQHLYYSLLR